MLYNNTILELFRQPQHAGELPAATPAMLSAVMGNPGQTDVVQLQLQIIDSIITAAKFKAAGAVTTIASAEYLLRQIINKPLAIAMNYTSETIIADLQLPAHRISSAILVEDCLHKALKNG